MTVARLYRSVPLTELLRHCQLYGCDRFVADDFTAVLDSASDDDREALARYRRARMRAPGFNRGSYTSNNHERIPPPVLRELTEGSGASKLAELTCHSCGSRFTARRADRRSCSDRCRKRLSRSQRPPGVTPRAT